ncbi:MAG: hypothetical protein K2K57_08895 [Oscillospiraceae bacterium]|nr:hypothetical protein [Oscillospiraceae bacterium]
MNVHELKNKLDELGVSGSCSILGQKYPSESYCLMYEDSLWKYYYSERGCRSNLKEFESEEEACEYCLKQVKRDMQY